MLALMTTAALATARDVMQILNIRDAEDPASIAGCSREDPLFDSKPSYGFHAVQGGCFCVPTKGIVTLTITNELTSLLLFNCYFFGVR